MPFVEVFLWSMCILIAWTSGSTTKWCQPMFIAIWGAVAIGASYLLMPVGGMIALAFFKPR